MNDLSWLIYAAGIAGSIKVILGISAGLSALGLLSVMLFHGFEDDFEVVRRAVRWVWLPFCLALLAGVIPSTKTIYMIAASEMGETVVKSPDTQEALSDLKAIIKKRLKDELTD